LSSFLSFLFSELELLEFYLQDFNKTLLSNDFNGYVDNTMDNKVPAILINFPWSSKHWRGCRKVELNCFCVLNVIWGRQKQLNVFILKFPLSSSNNCRRVSLLDRWRRITNEFSFQKFFKDFYFAEKAHLWSTSQQDAKS
jgi:hypothetical protein